MVQYKKTTDFENAQPLDGTELVAIIQNGINKKITTADFLGTHFNNDTTYIFTQNTPSELWVINHNLNKYPSVDIVDSAGSIVEGDVVYADTNTIMITFSNQFSGMAYLN